MLLRILYLSRNESTIQQQQQQHQQQQQQQQKTVVPIMGWYR